MEDNDRSSAAGAVIDAPESAPRGKRPRRGLSRLYHAPMFSPTGYLVRAAELVLAFLICHAVGLRHHVSILSGSLAAGGLSSNFAGALGIIYLVFYFALVLIVPILALAAVLFTIAQAVLLRKARLRAAGASSPSPVQADDLVSQSPPT